MAMKQGEKVAVGIGLAAAAAAGGIALATRKPASSSTAPPQGSGAANVQVKLSGGPSGTITDPQGGRLPDLTVILDNSAGTADALVAVSLPIEPVSGTTYTGGKWFFYAGQTNVKYNSDRSQATVLVPAGQAPSLKASKTWSGHAGTYRTVADVGVNGGAMQTFADTQTFTVLTAAVLKVQLSGGPSGTISGTEGSTTTHVGGAITAVVTNTGGEAYSGTLSMIVAPAGSDSQASNLEFFDLSTGSATRQVNIPASGSDTSQWVTNWTFELSSDGQYHAVLEANP